MSRANSGPGGAPTSHVATSVLDDAVRPRARCIAYKCTYGLLLLTRAVVCRTVEASIVDSTAMFGDADEDLPECSCYQGSSLGCSQYGRGTMM